MGVDAEMFVRIHGKQNWLSEDDVKRLSYEIGTGFTTGFFFTMHPSEGIFDKVRRALEIMPPIKDEEDAEYHGLPVECVGKMVWTQDGEPIIATDDEQFINVNLYGRYYGKNYERGDWPSLRSCIYWLSVRIPQGQVWYGGDSSGCCAEHATTQFLNDMDMHWALHTRRPYVRYENKFKGMFGAMPMDNVAPPVCQLCDVPMAECGGSRDFGFYWCDGCGAKASKHHSGKIAYAKKHEDYPTFNAAGDPEHRKERL